MNKSLPITIRKNNFFINNVWIERGEENVLSV